MTLQGLVHKVRLLWNSENCELWTSETFMVCFCGTKKKKQLDLPLLLTNQDTFLTLVSCLLSVYLESALGWNIQWKIRFQSWLRGLKIVRNINLVSVDDHVLFDLLKITNEKEKRSQSLASVFAYSNSRRNLYIFNSDGDCNQVNIS